MIIHDEIKIIADNFLNYEIKVDSSISYMPSGFNGPYLDFETPVRNTAHWLVTYSNMYLITKQNKYCYIANNLKNFFVKSNLYQIDNHYIHRYKKGKDSNNGVIGQAWVIEALCSYAKIFQDKEVYKFVLNLSQQYTFNENISLWAAVDVINGTNKIDYTLNHQLWYAYSLSLLDDEFHNKNIIKFLNGLHSGVIRCAENGLINHIAHVNNFKGSLIKLLYFKNKILNSKSQEEKEVGYHLYNLLPLNKLCSKFPEHPLFKSSIYRDIFNFALTDKFISDIVDNKYSYMYNSPFFECYSIFGTNNNCDLVRSFPYVLNDVGIIGNTYDVITLNSRVYEYFI